jgi:hypothetical protein
MLIKTIESRSNRQYNYFGSVVSFNSEGVAEVPDAIGHRIVKEDSRVKYYVAPEVNDGKYPDVELGVPNITSNNEYINQLKKYNLPQLKELAVEAGIPEFEIPSSKGEIIILLASKLK